MIELLNTIQDIMHILIMDGMVGIDIISIIHGTGIPFLYLIIIGHGLVGMTFVIVLISYILLLLLNLFKKLKIILEKN